MNAIAAVIILSGYVFVYTVQTQVNPNYTIDCGAYGECLISLTHFRSDLTKHTNGILSRITPSGQLTQLVNSTNFIWMVQDAQGTIYARTDNFVSQRRSTTNGAAFTEVTQPAPGFVFTTDNRAINYNGTNGFTISNVGFTSTQPLTLNGFTGASWMVTIRSPSEMIVSPAANGWFKSPEMIEPMLTIAIRIVVTRQILNLNAFILRMPRALRSVRCRHAG